jgi:hypothetical protein
MVAGAGSLGRETEGVVTNDEYAKLVEECMKDDTEPETDDLIRRVTYKLNQEAVAELEELRRSNAMWFEEAKKPNSEIAKLRRELANYASVIHETLQLSGELNIGAERGAGFVEHWGERVLQAVEPLRNVAAFPDRVLQHNRVLLEANSENIEKLEQFRRERDEAQGMRMKAEFWAKHCPWKPGCGPVSRDGVMAPCSDPGHDWTDEQWIKAAKKD